MKKNYHTAEHEEIIKRYKLGDRSVENEIVNIFNNLIDGIITKQVRKGKPLPLGEEELKDQMMLHLFKCVLPAFDPALGYKFYSYATLSLFHHYGDQMRKIILETPVDPFILDTNASESKNDFMDFEDWCFVYETEDKDTTMIAKKIKDGLAATKHGKKHGHYTLCKSKLITYLRRATNIDKENIEIILKKLVGEYYQYQDTI